MFDLHAIVPSRSARNVKQAIIANSKVLVSVGLKKNNLQIRSLTCSPLHKDPIKGIFLHVLVIQSINGGIDVKVEYLLKSMQNKICIIS